MGMKMRARAVMVAVAAAVAAGMVGLPAGPAAAASDAISGTTTQGGSPIQYGGVEVFTPDPDGEWEWLTFVSADANGHYSVLLPHGQYRIMFHPYGEDYVDTFYGGGSDLESATTVNNSSGPVTGIDGAVAKAGKIVGTVPQFKTHGGGVWAYAETSTGNWESVGLGEADTVDGGYTINGLATGSYKVLFAPFGDFAQEYYDNAPDLDGAQTVEVTSGSTTGPVDATLVPLGKISGRVITSAGAAVPDVRVDAFEKVGNSWNRVIRYHGGTDTHGRYQLPLGPGVYRIRFSDTRGKRAFEYWPNVRSINKATSITVTSGATRTGKNAILELGGSISGVVHFPTGVPTSAVLWQTNENVEGKTTLYDAVTGEVVKTKYVFARVGETSGYGYKFVGIPAGRYRVAFARDTRGVSNIEAQFYSGKPESVGIARATVFSLAAGQARTGIGATMRIGGTLTGYVLRSDGSPAAGCHVYAYTGDGSRAARGSDIGPDGLFRVQGLTTGAYRLKVVTSGDDGRLAFRAHCRTTEFYQGGSGALTKAEAEGKAVHVTATRDTFLATPLYYGLGTAPSLETIQNTALPTITGTLHAGQTLTAHPGTWSPTAGTVRYQWLRDGYTIAGEVGSKYRVRTADKGHKISVRVSAYAPNDNPGVAFSAQRLIT